MPLDSDVANGDAQLHVEFFVAKEIDPRFDGQPFVRINIPGDKTTVVEQPVREEHKRRFPRQWLYFQMKQDEVNGLQVLGTSLDEWCAASPEDLTKPQIEELRILRFQTVEQVAAASDQQLQRIGMGGPGLRERAKAFLARKNKSETQEELDKTKQQLAELQAQMSELLGARKPGRPRKTEDS
jgi:hypothetical protein